MRKSFAIALAATLCAAVSAFAYPRKAADITVSGYNGSALTNFPVLVRISPERISGFSYADCAIGGADIAFKDAQDNVLDREIDTWNTEGESLVWVRIPSLVQNTVFTMTYKDPSVTAQPACQTNGSVWTGANYIGVWHFGEDGGAAADSTGHGLNGTQTGNTSLAPQSKVGGARAVSSGALQVANYESTYGGATVFSASGWFYCPGVTAGYRSIMNKKTTAGAAWSAASGWYLEMDNSLTKIGLIGCNNTKYTCNIPNITQGWNYFHVVSSGSNVKLYLNGSASPGINQNHALKAAGVPLNLMPTVGYADEFRIRGAANSADWTVAEYQTVANAAFLTYGTAQNLPGDFIQVVGLPVAYSSNNSPAYGTTVNPAAGTHAFTAPQFVEVSAGVRAYCTGWSLAAVADGVETPVRTSASPASGEDDFTCVIDYAGAGGQILAWNWEIRYRVTAATETGGSVSPAEQWVASGATATMTATADATHSFYKWTNDVPASVSATSPTISFPVTAPMSLFATFGNVLYVAANGSDANGGTSWEDAFATPEKALSIAPHGSIVLVGDGTYLINAQSLKMTNAVKMASVNGPSATILRAYNAGKTFATGTSSTWRWVLEMRNNEAVADGFTLENGRRYNASPGASGLWLYNGLVTNCVIRDCRGGMTGDNSGGGAYVGGGTLAGCVIYGNSAYYNNNSTGKGGGIAQSAGLVTGCVITNNGAGGNGCGVYISGGTMRNTLISRNHGVNSSFMSSGAAVYMDGGTVDSCVITGNVSYVTSAGGVHLNNSKAILRNCLVAGNHARTTGGGVLLANGRVENCTIAGNSSSYNAGDGTGLRMTGGTAVNNVIYGNVTAAGASDTYVSGGTFKTNVVSQTLSVFAAGDGNVAANPLFVNAAAHDYRLHHGSPAIDAANPSTAVKTDLAGTIRPQGAANDIGCYEYASSGALACSFGATAQTYLDTASPTFTASVAGAAGEVSYAWYLDGVLQPSLTGATAMFADIGYGRHSIKLVVTDGATTDEFEAPGVVSVVASTAYVSTTGSDTYPYDTPEKAASKIQDAIDAVWASDAAPGTVLVGPGRYYTDAQCIYLTRPVRVLSTEGPGATTVQARYTQDSSYRHVFRIKDAKAFLAGFTLTGATWYSQYFGSRPGAVWLQNGSVSNCVFRGNHGDNCGGAVRIDNGLLTHCVITNNSSYYSGNTTYAGRGGGVYMTNGEVAHCEIRNNTSRSKESSTGGTGCGVWMSNGHLHDCVIANNYVDTASDDARRGQGLSITGGIAERCVITNNFNKSYEQKYAGGVFIGGGTLRNCLVAGNTVKSNGGGIYQTGGTVEFCTVVGNTSTASSNSGLYLNGSGAVCRYNIIFGNGAGVAAEPNCNISFAAAASFATNIVSTASGTTYGTDNIYDAPLFAAAQSGDYTLSTGSPAIDAAVGADWVANDLTGNARPEDGNGNGTAVPDLGCYEAPDASAGPLQCSFSPDSVESAGATTVSFTAAASGAGSQGTLTYVWTLPGATDITTSNGGASVTATYTESGAYDVTLAVTAANETTASASIASCVKIGTDTIFVDASNETPVWPYATWATAATNVQDVFDTIIIDPSKVTTVTVTNGTYKIKDSYIALSYPIVLRSVNGPEFTTISAAYSIYDARRHFNLTHPEAVLAGFMLSGAHSDAWNTSDHGASSLRISAGVVSNCIVTGAVTDRSTYGAVSVSGTGLFTHSIVRNSYSHKSTSSGAVVHGGGLTVLDGGTAEYCVITNCHVTGASGTSGGGAYVLGGILRDSQILDCYAKDSGANYGGALHQTGGTVERCIIGDTKREKAGGEAVRMGGGLMRNCLIRGAISGLAQQALYMTGGSAVNCTVVTNGFGSAAASPIAAVIAGGSVSNCLFAVNAGGDVSQTGGTVAYCRYAEAGNANGNISAAPMLVLPAEAREGKPSWSLKSGSPCINKGSYFALGATKNDVRQQIDLIGRPRFVSFGVDMGCFESAGGAGTMIILK